MNNIRGLAKSTKWQVLYARAKELNNIKLFNNEADFSKIQLIFLQWLAIYNSLHNDLASGAEYLDEGILNNEILTDAYLYFRKHKNDKKEESKKKKEKLDSPDRHSIHFFEGRK